MRESRVALAAQPLPDIVLTNFVRELWPYRRRNTQVLQLSFYLVASSILSKSPLLRENPAEIESGGQYANFMHDVLVLASRLAKTSDGASAIRSVDFTRYFHYIVGITSVHEHLKVKHFHMYKSCNCRSLILSTFSHRILKSSAEISMES